MNVFKKSALLVPDCGTLVAEILVNRERKVRSASCNEHRIVGKRRGEVCDEDGISGREATGCRLTSFGGRNHKIREEQAAQLDVLH